MAASPLPSRGDKKEGKIYNTRDFSGLPNAKPGGGGGSKVVHNKGYKNQKWKQERGTKSEVAASPLPYRGPKRGRKCYVSPAFSGVRKSKPGEEIEKWCPRQR